MRDGINTARLGIPAVSLVTEDFWPQGNFTAKSLGMPDMPRVKLPHPLAGTGQQNLRDVAAAMVTDVIAGLRND